MIGLSATIVHVLLNVHTLDLWSSHFKMTMIHNFEVVMCDQENNLNPLTQLWRKVTASPIFHHKISKYMKLVKIATIQVLGCVENECLFNTLSFMKNRL
jgi:hypothetical protein